MAFADGEGVWLGTSKGSTKKRKVMKHNMETLITLTKGKVKEDLQTIIF